MNARFRLLTTMTVLFAATTAHAQTVLRVRANAPAGGNGASWATAYNDLQAAINISRSVPSATPVQIWVAGGTYLPTQLNPPTDPRSASFREFRNNTTILGGFAGQDATPTLRNPQAHPTILSGDIGATNADADNAFTVLTLLNNSGMTFDGLLIEKGVSDTGTRNVGAGVNINLSTATFRNVIIRNNRAGSLTPSGQTGTAGGVIFQFGTGTTVFEDCRFENNFANGQGGAMFVNSNPANPNSALEFRGCVFQGNTAGAGGAIATVRAQFINFLPGPSGNTKFISNTALTNGGAIYRRSDNPTPLTLTGVEFLSNTVGDPLVNANANGGAVSLQSNPAAPNTDVLTDCTFISNRNLASPANNFGGAGLSAADTNVRLLRCIFTSNDTGPGANGRGGALYLAGSVSSTPDSTAPSAILDRCTFAGNSAPDAIGGAIYAFQAPLEARNGAFYANASGQGGFAIYHDRPVPAAGGGFSGPRLINCVFTGNTCSLNPTPDQFGSFCRYNSASGVVNARGNTFMAFCTLTRNYGDLNAGVFFGWDGITPQPTPRVVNSIFYANTARPKSYNFYSDEIDGTNPVSFPGALIIGNPGSVATFNITNTCVQGLVSSASGNTGSDPQFVDPDGADNVIGTLDDNPRLQPTSPLADTGDASIPVLLADPRDDDADTSTAEPLPLDFGGGRRVLDLSGVPAGGPTGPIPDPGAYETPPPATQNETFWVEPTGGAFAASGNWSPRVPTAADTMVFDLAGLYSVALGANAVAGSMQVRRDEVTLNLSGRSLTLTNAAQPMVVAANGPNGSFPADAARLTLSNGSLASTSALLANAPGTSADIALNAAAWSNSGSSFCVGCLGNAALRINAGASVSTPFATLGQQPGASGLIDVSGSGALWQTSLLTVVQRGTLLVRNGATAQTGLAGTLVLQEGALAGNASLSGPVLNFGAVAPGSVAPAPGAPASIGSFSLTSGYQQVGVLQGTGAASGSLRIELAQGDNDRLNVTGNSLLAGGLFVSLANGFLPPVGAYNATILSSDTLGNTTGGNAAFDVAFFPGLADGRYFQLQYTTDGNGRRVVRVVQATLASDIATGNNQDFGTPGLPTDAVLTDLDKDGFRDLALAVPAATSPDTTPGSVIVLRNLGVNTGGAWQGFASQLTVTVGLNPVDIAVADFNNDSKSDIVVVNRASGTLQTLLNTSTGPGNLSFNALSPSVPVGINPGGVAAINYNADAFTDAVVTVAGAGSTGSLLPLRNQGVSGNAWQNFAPESPIPVGNAPTAVAAGNLEGATDPNGPDVVVANTGTESSPGSTLTVLFNTGFSSNPSARFGSAQTINVGPSPDLILLDLESDKDTDSLASIISVNNRFDSARGAGSGSASIVRVFGNGQFSPAVNFEVGSDPTSVAAADLDQDGDRDLAFVTRAQPGDPASVVRVLRNDQQPPTPGQIAPLAFAPLLSDLSTSGDPLLVLAGNIDTNPTQDLIVISSQTLGARAAQRTPGDSTVTVVPTLSPVTPPTCPGDFVDPPGVGTPDLVYFIGRFGQTFQPPGSERADLNADGIVSTPDLVTFIGLFGRPCP